MSCSLVPDRVFSKYEEITPEALGELGITLLLSDLDFTLAPKSVSRPDEGLRQWIAALGAAGITLMIVSNNRSGRPGERVLCGSGRGVSGPRRKALAQGAGGRHA